MKSIAALERIGKLITSTHVETDCAMVAEFVDYLRWLAEQDTNMTLTAGQIWELYYECVLIGRHWSEVCDDVELPIRECWS